MRSNLAALFLGLIALSSGPTARADWPTRVFAPYLYLDNGDHFRMTDCYQACGLKYYTLAFLIAKEDRTQTGGKPTSQYQKQVTWAGHIPLDDNVYADQVAAIRKDGGDVIASFGGEGGKEIAFIEEDPATLLADYQAILDRYHFNWLDFDIEGDTNLNMKFAGNTRRNVALAELQKKNPGLRISFTLPVDPMGISDESQALLKDAVAKDVKVQSVDLMVMFFGQKYINQGKSEAELGIESAQVAHGQIGKIDPTIQIGLCPCLGRNGSAAEVFTLDDAKQIKAFADQTPWVVSLHYWSINNDTGVRRHRRPSTRATTQPAPPPPVKPWAFATLFQSFTTTPR